MSIQTVQLGSPRTPGEGLRIGTVRRPPRGVTKSDHARLNWYDVWFPNLAPSTATMKLGQQASTDREWQHFIRKYLAELDTPIARHEINLLVSLSRQCNFSIGCYCEEESKCHRSILGELLREQGGEFREA